MAEGEEEVVVAEEEEKTRGMFYRTVQLAAAVEMNYPFIFTITAATATWTTRVDKKVGTKQKRHTVELPFLSNTHTLTHSYGSSCRFLHSNSTPFNPRILFSAIISSSSSFPLVFYRKIYEKKRR